MHYKVSISNATEHFILIESVVEHIHQDTLHLQLPAWRPGRYELQNYAKNIRRFRITGKNNEPVPFKKISKDCWEVNTAANNELHISYEYYANQYDAGASYVDEKQLYVNPVNCFMYKTGCMDEPFTIALNVPDSYRIACQLPVENKTLHAKNFDELADSPFIASDGLAHASFEAGACLIHLWFQGQHDFDIGRLKKDTLAYTMKQTSLFGDMPCREYHFLYHLLDRPFRHGVEHADSTVIAMGKMPDQDDESFYNDLLAISCHELFHLWNIKRIRPVDMLPYDFTRENYSTLGYVYEGVTTYYGDLLLAACGVWNWEKYKASFEGDLKRHVDNPGRFNYSVAESSFDTWLDGYVPGVPGRKVSIYMEGMLAAFVADVLIIKHSDARHSLDDVMRSLYVDFYKTGKGYAEEDYRLLLERYAGISFAPYFRDLIWGAGHFEKFLKEITQYIGCKLTFETYELNRVDDPSPAQKKLFDKWIKR